MHSTECRVSDDCFVVETADYGIQDFPLTLESVRWLWEQMQRFRTLFSDATIGDLDNYVRLVTLPNSMWFRVVSKQSWEVVGILYITDIQPLCDMTVHVIFFDRKFTDKVEICAAHLRYMFATLNTHRASALIPDIYHATIRFAERVGFKREGIRRESVLIGGRWRDEIMLGILQREY
jgi:RimJ/RimL family protein N-acetyltransferase